MKRLSSIRQHLLSVDPTLTSIISHLGDKPLSVSKDPFSDLVEAIINQQLSEKAGSTIFARFTASFPQGTLTPQHILKRSDQSLRDLGVSWSKVTYMKSLAEAVSKKHLILADLDKMDDEGVITELTKIKGIGRWTAEMFLMFSLGREDVFSYGDLGLRRAIAKLYKFRDYPTTKQMEKIVKKWQPYRTFVAKMLWASLDTRE
jgi:DNA-3-methyladenine glycosylase II